MKTQYYDGAIPFSARTGDQLDYAWSGDRLVEWRPNEPFTATLTFLRFKRGRSAAHAIFRKNAGHEVTVFLTDFAAMVPLMVDGRLKSKFVYCKRGSNFGCKLLHAVAVETV